MPKLAYSNL